MKVLSITYFSVIAIVFVAAEIVPEDDWSPTTESDTVEDVTNQIPNDENEGILQSPTRQRRTIGILTGKVLDAALEHPEVVDAVYARVLYQAGTDTGGLANIIRSLAGVAYQVVRENILNDVRYQVLPTMGQFFGKMIRRHRKGDDRLVLDAAYPWIVALHSSYNHTTGQCSGSVIDPKFVITSVQCLYDGSQRNGNDHVKVLSSDGQSAISHYFADVIPYSLELGSVTLKPNYDIAVIVLSNPIQNIQPISLPPMNLEVPPGTYARAFGWGSTNYDTMSRSLRNSLVMAIQCPNFQYNANFPFICIESSISSPCPEDSGAPLISGNYLVGVVSKRVRPCGTGTVVFTKVAQYIPWIRRVTLGQI
ncbi:hypothetical protein QAD02_005228 [Eretmocerus hayati]|uniref:Uncharacterized protein n=1 Tax=Eretmocerus hayati TaxID=131215 RepID=A0ACC2NSX5_9HYME|nr:hypothetical protein QAD02_005228 [Eretmocerus hayati]